MVNIHKTFHCRNKIISLLSRVRPFHIVCLIYPISVRVTLNKKCNFFTDPYQVIGLFAVFKACAPFHKDKRQCNWYKQLEYICFFKNVLIGNALDLTRCVNRSNYSYLLFIQKDGFLRFHRHQQNRLVNFRTYK